MKKNLKIIGTFKGKCCDAEIYNNNGMLLDKELFDTLINSEEYKRAIENRYYIGFLGHPEDPNCMDFKHGCIIMTSMEMHDNGDIYGTFDLVDTPVGRVVKSFIDAGVTFGISIRGAGDIDSSGRVDPDTFIFRGYDLVTFPAYDDAVPEFQEIAASSNIYKQTKYKKVCTTIKNNLSKINSCEALEVIQSQFNENSSEYKTIDRRIEELTPIEATPENYSMLQEKLEAMTHLYIEAMKDNQKLFDEINRLKLQSTRIAADTRKKIRSLKRITSSQLANVQEDLRSIENKYMTVVTANSHLKSQNQEYVIACDNLEIQLKEAKKESQSLLRKTKKFEDITASSEHDFHVLQEELKNTKSKLKEIKNSNLLYQEKIESTNQLIIEKDKAISKLKSQLRETVTANGELNKTSLNHSDENESLRQEIMSCNQLISDYQQAYADMCANAVGVSIDDIPITSSTSPEALRKHIFGSTSTSGIPAKPAFDQPEQMEIIDSEYDDYSTFGLTTL